MANTCEWFGALLRRELWADAEVDSDQEQNLDTDLRDSSRGSEGSTNEFRSASTVRLLFERKLKSRSLTKGQGDQQQNLVIDLKDVIRGSKGMCSESKHESTVSTSSKKKLQNRSLAREQDDQPSTLDTDFQETIRGSEGMGSESKSVGTLSTLSNKKLHNGSLMREQGDHQLSFNTDLEEIKGMGSKSISEGTATTLSKKRLPTMSLTGGHGDQQLNMDIDLEEICGGSQGRGSKAKSESIESTSSKTKERSDQQLKFVIDLEEIRRGFEGMVRQSKTKSIVSTFPKKKLQNISLTREQFISKQAMGSHSPTSSSSQCSANDFPALPPWTFVPYGPTFSAQSIDLDILSSTAVKDDWVFVSYASSQSDTLDIPAMAAQDSLRQDCTEDAKHERGECKPCMFNMSVRGCFKGPRCNFCHFPHSRSQCPRPCKVKRDRIKKLVERALQQ